MCPMTFYAAAIAKQASGVGGIALTWRKSGASKRPVCSLTCEFRVVTRDVWVGISGDGIRFGIDTV